MLCCGAAKPHRKWALSFAGTWTFASAVIWETAANTVWEQLDIYTTPKRGQTWHTELYDFANKVFISSLARQMNKIMRRAPGKNTSQSAPNCGNTPGGLAAQRHATCSQREIRYNPAFHIFPRCSAREQVTIPFLFLLIDTTAMKSFRFRGILHNGWRLHVFCLFLWLHALFPPFFSYFSSVFFLPHTHTHTHTHSHPRTSCDLWPRDLDKSSK